MSLSAPSDVWSIPNLIPPEGTLPRCQHSHYWPTGHALAWCCQFCNPTAQRPNGAPLSVILPRTNGHHNPDGAIFANKRNPNACPACNSVIHSEEPGGKNWRCEEPGCGVVYPKPKKKKNAESN